MSSSSQLAHVCQRCCNPLRLSQDFDSLPVTKLQALVDALRPEKEDPSPSTLLPVRNTGLDYPRYVVPANPASTVFDGESPTRPGAPPSGLDHRQKVNACLFDVLSGRTEVDHPLCQECADTLLAAEQQVLEFQEEELNCLKSYLSYLEGKAARAEAKLTARRCGLTESSMIPTKSDQNTKDFKSDLSDYDTAISDTALDTWASCFSSPTSRERPAKVCNSEFSELDSWLEGSSDEDNLYGDDSGDDGESELPLQGIQQPQSLEQRRSDHSEGKVTRLLKLNRKVSDLQASLSKLLNDGAKLDEQLVKDTSELERQKAQLDKEQTKYNYQKQQLLEAEEELFSLEARVNQAKSQLQRLQHTNVLNTAFPIWYDGHIGVINGLHLGRLANRPITWEEINAAWGQCALLLQCIAKKLNHTFLDYRLIPMGSQSKVIELSSQREHPLFYSSSGMRYLSSGKFDSAMMCFLKCVGQVQLQVESSTGVQLTYRIKDGGKIQDPEDQRLYSIKWSGNSEENWTKALKMMLINLKWIIAGLSARRLRQRITTATPSKAQPNEGTSNECAQPASPPAVT